MYNWFRPSITLTIVIISVIFLLSWLGVINGLLAIGLVMTYFFVSYKIVKRNSITNKETDVLRGMFLQSEHDKQVELIKKELRNLNK